jgi:ribonuclease III family protein
MINPDLLNGSALAFIGDAVLSLYVREHLLETGLTKAKDLQETSTKYVSAKAQSQFIMKLLADNVLTPQELLIYKRGRNHRSDSIAKNADVVTYRQATGFEALIGYWYLTLNETRLKQIWDQMKTTI